jgi:hypothetical protein
MRIERILVDDVDVGNRLRPLNERTIAALAKSMQRRGQLSPRGLTEFVSMSGTNRMVSP